MPPVIVPFSVSSLKICGVITGITSSARSVPVFITPGFSNVYVSSTSKYGASPVATACAIVSAFVFSIFPCPSCVRGAITGIIPDSSSICSGSGLIRSTSPTQPKSACGVGGRLCERIISASAPVIPRACIPRACIVATIDLFTCPA